MSTTLAAVTDHSFELDVLQSEIPVLVDFWAEWCGPCQRIAPVLAELALEYSGKIRIVQVNVEEQTATTQKYGIRGIPALLLFKNGKIVATKAGFLTKAQLTDFLTSHLS